MKDIIMKFKKILVPITLLFTLGIANHSLAYGIEWGNDDGNWSNDGECDDPRFAGPGTASTLVEIDRMRDATDCRQLFEQGRIWLNPATQGNTLVTRITTPQVEALLRHQGFTNISVDSDNDIVVHMNGYRVLIFARDNNYTNVKVRFSLGSDSVRSANITLDVINRWNVERKFTKAYMRDTSGSVSLEMDISLRGGVSIDHISESLQMFDQSMRQFLSHIGA